MTGLTISLNEFEKLPQKKQMALLFENTETLKIMVSNYKTELKIHRFGFGLILILIGAGKLLGLI